MYYIVERLLLTCNGQFTKPGLADYTMPFQGWKVENSAVLSIDSKAGLESSIMSKIFSNRCIDSCEYSDSISDQERFTDLTFAGST